VLPWRASRLAVPTRFGTTEPWSWKDEIMRKRITYANVTATLALLLALGGSAVAATQLAPDSVGAKHIRSGAVRSSEVQDGSLAPRDLANGGPAGFAYVRVDVPGTYEVVYGKGVTDVAPTLTAGEYDVTFTRKVARCAAVATPTIGYPRGGDLDADLSSFAGIIIDPDTTVGVKDRVVRAQFYDDNGNPRDTSFTIVLFCGR
jgi:hypothetical protein